MDITIRNGTQQLNKKISEKLDPGLFLFASYNEEYPKKYKTITQEGQYYQQILELYKALRDSCFMLYEWNMKSVLVGKDEYTAQQKWVKNWKNLVEPLLEKVNLVACQRHILAHNVNTALGPLYQEERSQYENWIASVLEGRTVPVTEEDYEKLIGALNVLEKEIYQGLNKLLLMIERSADKNEIIDRWMDKLVERYKKQKDLFYNILGNQILLKANCRNSAEFYQKEMLTVREAAQKVLWNDYQRLIRIDKERGKDTIQTGVRRLNGLKDDADVNAWHYEVYFFEKRMPDQLRRIYKSPQYTGTMEPSDMFAEFVSKSLRYHLEWNS